MRIGNRAIQERGAFRRFKDKIRYEGIEQQWYDFQNHPVREWNGGKIHRIRPSVIHLMRGQVFELDGKKIFTFGGASSHDIDGGILEPDDPDYKKRKKNWIKAGFYCQPLCIF